MPTTKSRRFPQVDAELARRLALVFICIVSIVLLLLGSILEATSPYLVLVPTLLAAFQISRMRTH
ncbi:hypothetical protein DEU36_2867 [Microbacterium sp. AG238]|nr:hypothetical protein DEU36_2867 [Microbacterium sp. AG238]